MGPAHRRMRPAEFPRIEDRGRWSRHCGLSMEKDKKEVGLESPRDRHSPVPSSEAESSLDSEAKSRIRKPDSDDSESELQICNPRLNFREYL